VYNEFCRHRHLLPNTVHRRTIPLLHLYIDNPEASSMPADHISMAMAITTPTGINITPHSTRRGQQPGLTVSERKKIRHPQKSGKFRKFQAKFNEFKNLKKL
jgi:hypothetical protein